MDFADTLQHQHALQHALEARFGRPATWPLKIQAAYRQLEALPQLIGDDYYNTFIRYAQRAVEERRGETGWSISQERRERFGLLLHEGAYALPDTLQIVWAVNFGLEILLQNEQYEQLIDAAAEAAAPAAISSH
ncbi:hypothetical protein PUR59_00445 [Streptomyces sp. SP18ES09]|uniref:hypothetical protein n=1 Tax=Streptomyces sp. SP18ES09 TaxID=3002532 RepID=UPI002E787B34|nr:hypothetical protein [Streptomyces sp. SP18ES09]MEE1813520.1 hypothetical protein [Streptomyces sp. SP18ES09]